jgi:hypothetical protein
MCHLFIAISYLLCDADNLKFFPSEEAQFFFFVRVLLCVGL